MTKLQEANRAKAESAESAERTAVLARHLAHIDRLRAADARARARKAATAPKK